MSNIDQQPTDTVGEQVDDSLAYARSLEKAEAESQQAVNDPLAAVKNMRLQQLAACRIKTAEELKTNMDKRDLDKTKADSNHSD